MKTKIQILNPSTVAASLEHLITACHRDDSHYSDNLSIIVGYMGEFTTHFDDAPYRLILRKQHHTEIKNCSQICKNGNCTDEFCHQQFEKALRAIVEPVLDQLDQKTKSHLSTLSKEMPHMQHLFTEFHDKIAA